MSETSLPSPTSIPTSAPIPERSLDPVGPWLLLTSSDSPWALYNLDGTGQTQIELPEELLVTDWWGRFTHTSNSCRYLSTIVAFPKDPQLWIFKLPNKTPILQLSLVGEKARSEIENFKEFDFGFGIFVYVSPILSAIGDTAWSPNGRYLAFTGAINGPSSDIYIYDTERFKLTQLTSGPNQAGIMGWSPNSQTIIHYSAEWQVDYMELIESLWTVDVSGNVRELIELNELMINPYIADWINPTTLVFFYPIFEGNPRNLTIMDIQTGETEIIDVPFFRHEIFFEQSTNQLLINYGAVMSGGPIPGVYSYDLDTKQLSTIIEGSRLAGEIENTPYYISTNGDLLISSGEIVGTIPAGDFEMQLPIASPDGNWLITYKSNRDDRNSWVTSLLMNSAGEAEQEWDFVCHDPVWLDDSSGFFCYPAGQILLITEENDWEPVLINTMPVGAILIIRP